MLATSLAYIVVQLPSLLMPPALAASAAHTKNFALAALIVTIVSFVVYLGLQVRLAIARSARSEERSKKRRGRQHPPDVAKGLVAYTRIVCVVCVRAGQLINIFLKILRTLFGLF